MKQALTALATIEHNQVANTSGVVTDSHHVELWLPGRRSHTRRLVGPT